MQDRLRELRKHARYSEDEEEVTPEHVAVTVEGSVAAKQDSLDSFFKEVSDIKSSILQIEKNTQDLGSKSSAKVNMAISEKEQEVMQKITNLIESTNQIIKQTKGRIEALKAENAKLDKDKSKKGTAEMRIRQNQFQSITKAFMDAISAWQKEQEDSKNKYRETMKRQLRIVNQSATDRELDEAIESGGDNFFQEKILEKTGTASTVKAVYSEVQEKHRDILRIETSLLELNQLFQDLALLVETQGELLDNIQHNVSTSVEFVEIATENIQAASKYQSRARKVQCIIIIVVTVVALIIAALAVLAVPILIKFLSV